MSKKPEATEAVITQHAKVGGVRFHPGCSVSSVVEAAYRHYEHEVTPEFEAHRIERAGKLRQALIDRVHAGRPMSTAPKDGTRVLIHARCLGYDRKAGAYVANGDRWLECWFHEDRWQEWCGAKNVSSTSRIDPIAWMPLPCTEDLLLPKPGQAEQMIIDDLRAQLLGLINAGFRMIGSSGKARKRNSDTLFEMLRELQSQHGE